MNINKISGGKLLVSCLENLGADTCFGVPGESYLSILDALFESKIRLFTCRQEGAASFAASAWGKLTGKPGLCFVTRGPGATNASIGVHTAMQDSSPMILFVGQVPLNNKYREAFQEIDITSYFNSIAKMTIEINNVDRIPEIIARAWRISLSGRPGPVVISMPEDILNLKSNSSPCLKLNIFESGVDKNQIKEIINILSESKRPLILVGGSGWNNQGKNDLNNFCEKEKIAVATSFRCHDIFNNHSFCYIGDAGLGIAKHVSEAIMESDVIVAINVRFGEATTKSWTLLDVPISKQKIIHIHASEKELGKIYQPIISLQSGPNLFTSELLKNKLNVSNLKVRSNWTDYLNSQYKKTLNPPKQDSPVDMSKVISWLQKNLDDDVIITNGAGNFALWPNKVFAYGKKQSLLAPQSGSMGYGLPAAIAASIAFPNRQVICFAGDGDIQMCLAELGTLVQSEARVIIILLNNQSYGTIRMHQEDKYPGRLIGTKLVNPNFAKIANAFDILGIKVNRTEDFIPAFKKISTSKLSGLIDLNISIEAITPYKTLSKK